MADDALRRTVRRGTAVLTLPLASVAIGLDEFVWSDTYGASPPTAFGDVVYGLAPRALFVGAFLYLLAAGARDAVVLLDAATGEGREAAEDA